MTDRIRESARAELCPSSCKARTLPVRAYHHNRNAASRWCALWGRNSTFAFNGISSIPSSPPALTCGIRPWQPLRCWSILTILTHPRNQEGAGPIVGHGRGSSPALGSAHHSHPVWLHSIQTSPSKASFGEKDLSVLPSLLASSSESCLFCLGQFTAYRFCLQCMRLTVVHDKQRSGDFRTARGDPDSFDMHSAKITMLASSGCRLDSCVLT